MTLVTANNLGLVALVPGQASPENTANDKGGELDSFLTEIQTVSVSSGNETVSATDYPRYRKFRVTGNTVGGRTLTLQAIKREVLIDNSDSGNTQSINIVLGTTTLTLPAGKKGSYETDGTANGLELIISNDPTGISGFLALTGGTMTGAITLSADPASSLQPATKQYVDGIALNLGKRERVRAATTANITISSALNSGSVIDGVTLATGDQVLVKNQSTAAQNGVYVVGATPVRADQFDTYDEHPGALIAVEEGSTQARTIFLCTSNVGGTLNTTAIAFSQSSATGAALTANNLSDLANAATARSNLGVAVSAIEFIIDGGGSTITTGIKGYLEVPFACTITQATLLADQSGSIVVNVWKCSYANFDAGSTNPVAADKITASAPPTISTATKAQDATLTGWTASISAGDILAFNVDSVTTIQRVTLSLKVTR